ncbi:hypothetical protein PGTUg99_000080 [Puccinia graminis f. sp. tritici]|uniref:Uncharacterized protein n=1 Tax=Puccinia graminis f. sp. tritici TaxID=56615 RepID=A0A5B0QZS1_PUCGR|nr:hypothetical protein PGTUg99_000080 [Puccinia graminis f. sp. tritici]
MRPDPPRARQATLSWNSSNGTHQLWRWHETAMWTSTTNGHLPSHSSDGPDPLWGWEPASVRPRPSSRPKALPGHHQTAPISCGDGTKPPCGPLRSVVAFPGTHPGPCGDDISAPCDPMQPASLVGCRRNRRLWPRRWIVGPCVMITDPGREPPHPDLLPNSTAPIPGAVDDCGRGDGIEGPCVIIDPGREPPHPDLLPNPAVPNTCPDGSKGPCAHTQSPHHSSNFPGTHQTAPVTCGDGTKPHVTPMSRPIELLNIKLQNSPIGFLRRRAAHMG